MSTNAMGQGHQHDNTTMKERLAEAQSQDADLLEYAQTSQEEDEARAEDGGFIRCQEDRVDELEAFVLSVMPRDQEERIRAQVALANAWLREESLKAAQTLVERTADYAPDQEHDAKSRDPNPYRSYRGAFERHSTRSKEVVEESRAQANARGQTEFIDWDVQTDELGAWFSKMFPGTIQVPEMFIQEYVPLTDADGRLKYVPVLGLSVGSPEAEWPKLYRTEDPFRGTQYYRETTGGALRRLDQGRESKSSSEYYQHMLFDRNQELPRIKKQILHYVSVRQDFLDKVLPMIE